jgi:hypothetical protein
VKSTSQIPAPHRRPCKRLASRERQRPEECFKNHHAQGRR